MLEKGIDVIMLGANHTINESGDVQLSMKDAHPKGAILPQILKPAIRASFKQSENSDRSRSRSGKRSGVLGRR